MYKVVRRRSNYPLNISAHTRKMETIVKIMKKVVNVRNLNTLMKTRLGLEYGYENQDNDNDEYDDSDLKTLKKFLPEVPTNVMLQLDIIKIMKTFQGHNALTQVTRPKQKDPKRRYAVDRVM